MEHTSWTGRLEGSANVVLDVETPSAQDRKAGSGWCCSKEERSGRNC